MGPIRAIGVGEIACAKVTCQQRFRLRHLLAYNLLTVRAYLLKEDFQQFWEYNSPTWAGNFLDFWCREVVRSRIEPMKRVARMLRAHRELLRNYFKAKKEFSSGAKHFGLCDSGRHRW